jgi:hypothetical protein
MKPNNVMLTCLLWASASGAPLAGEKVDEVRAVPAEGVIHVHCIRGEVKIVGWDRAEAQVTGELDDLATSLDFDTRGEVTAIRVRMPEHGINRGDGSDLTLRLPRGVTLRVDVVSADVTVEGMAGPLAVRTVSGDVKASGAGTLIKVSTTSGDVDLDGGSDRVRVNTTSGETTIRMAASDVQVDSVSGDVELALQAFDSVIANTVNSDLEISGELRPNGRLESTSITSEVDIELAEPVNARLDIRAGPGGEIDNDLSEHEPATLLSSDTSLEVTLGDGSGQVLVRTVSGEIKLERR